MNLLFRNSAMPNLNRIFTDAQLRIPPSEIKPLSSAYEQLRDAGTRLAEAKAKLQAAETEATEATEAVRLVRDRVGVEMAAGTLEESAAAHAIREAHMTEELKRAKADGLRKRLQAVEAECISLATVFSEAHGVFTLAVRSALTKRLNEAADSFISVVSSSIALDAELGLGMIGLLENRVIVPGEAHPEDFSNWYEQPAARAMVEALDPLKQMIAQAQKAVADQNAPTENTAPAAVGSARGVAISAV